MLPSKAIERLWACECVSFWTKLNRLFRNNIELSVGWKWEIVNEIRWPNQTDKMHRSIIHNGVSPQTQTTRDRSYDNLLPSSMKAMSWAKCKQRNINLRSLAQAVNTLKHSQTHSNTLKRAHTHVHTHRADIHLKTLSQEFWSMKFSLDLPLEWSAMLDSVPSRLVVVVVVADLL